MTYCPMNCPECLFSNEYADLDYVLMHEIHITVEKADVEKFTEVCKEVGVKPVLLALENDSGVSMFDLMTSSIFKGSINDVLIEIERLEAIISNKGFRVIRKKIESVPWHPWAPTIENGLEFTENTYFESHVAVSVNEKNRAGADMIAKKHLAHCSRNIFKKNVDGSFVVMYTMRMEEPREIFERLRDSFVDDLKHYEYSVDKVITEFAWYDDKISHDSKWINGE